MVVAAELATILTVIEYSTMAYDFFSKINELTTEQFKTAETLLRDIHHLVMFQPDKTLLGKIDVKYERFQDMIQHWETIDNTTKREFAKEILFGDNSVDNAIRRFHNSVYEKDGYFDTKIKNWSQESIFTKTSLQMEKNFKEFFPAFVEVEMKAITLIYFGYYLEQLDSGGYENIKFW